MPLAPGPIIPRKQLAAELRRLRAEKNLRLEQVAKELMVSTSKLSRLENAQGSPQVRDVRDLIKLYEIEGTPTAEKLMRLARNARRQGWWNDYSFDTSGAATDIDAHVEYESEASIARVYTIPFIPALLQTKEYGDALYRSLEPWRRDHDVDQLVRLRLRRQEVLSSRGSKPRLELIAVAHESCLHQLVGSKQIMAAQLDALDNAYERRNVELRILPFSAAPPFTSNCMWAHFEFGDALDRDLVGVETHAGFRYTDLFDQVAQYRRHYDELVRRSLGLDASRALIKAMAERWKQST